MVYFENLNKNQIMKKIITQILMYIILLALIVGVVFLIRYAVFIINQTHIKAEFTELEPFADNLPVYFKGFEIGKVTKIEPKDDFTSTLMSITLYPEDIKFPKNIYIQMKRHSDDFTYAEVMLPADPEVKLLANGDIIEGKTNLSFDSILEKHAQGGSLDAIILALGEVMANVNNTVLEAEGLLKDVRRTVKNSEQYITTTTKNISEATGNFSKTTLHINNSVDQGSLDRTMENIENITQNIDCATRTLPETMENVESITGNVNSTMKKRFGGLRLFFGKP